MSEETAVGSEKVKEGKHRRRSSLSEAIQVADEHTHGSSPVAEEAALDGQKGMQLADIHIPDVPESSPWDKRMNSPFQDDTSSFPSETEHFSSFTSHSEPRKSGMMEASSSPFTPDDNPIYELCADDHMTSHRLSSPLGSVPEDEPATQAPPQSVGDMLQPEALQLPTVRTPRKAAPAPEERNPGDEKAVIDSQLSVDFSNYHSEDLDAAFNPFASGGEQPYASPSDMFPEAISGSSREERLFSMEMEGAPQADAGETLAPSGVGHLDFGSRDGAGVVGPRLDPDVSREKSADRFEVKEGEDAEIKQLLWVIENLQEELHISNRAFGLAEIQLKESQAIVDQLQRDLDAAKMREMEVEQRLGVVHSQLEGQLLAKLEKEEEIRESGMKLKQTRSEIEALDEQLAEADGLRKRLKAEVAEKRASQQNTSPEKKGQLGEEASPEDSPQSNYSSAWGDASDSDAEQQGLDLEELQETRPPTSIFEDNQAKVTEKGGKGGSWLRSVLGGISKKGNDSTPGGEDASKKREVFGASHSHFERPATAAELEPLPGDGLDAVPVPATAGEELPLPAKIQGASANLSRQNSEALA